MIDRKMYLNILSVLNDKIKKYVLFHKLQNNLFLSQSGNLNSERTHLKIT